MKAKFSLGLIVAVSIALGMFAGSTAFSPALAEGQPAPNPVAPEPVLIRFTMTASPIFEGGAVGQSLPLTVEIRGASQDVPLVAWRQELPSKVKQALEWELAKAEPSNPFNAATGVTSQVPGDQKTVDQILERLDKLEKRIKQIEKKKVADGR